MKREFKDLVRFEHYENLNSEITGVYDKAHAVKRVNGTNIPDEIFTTTQQMWTNFARCGNPSTDKVDWKAYRADDPNVLVIAGPDDMHVEQGLLAKQYKAVLPLVNYYQFMDKYFTPQYLMGVIAGRG